MIGSKKNTSGKKTGLEKLDSFLFYEFENKNLVLKIVILLGLFLIFVLALKPPSDPDLGWHLKTGELVWQYKTLPYSDWYSYTMPDNFIWVDKEWLIEVLMHGIYSFFGYWGLSAFFAGVVALVFGFLAGEITAIKPRWENRMIMGVFATMVSMAFVGIRPQVMALLFLALLLLIIQRLYQNEKTKTVWLLPALFLFWVNMHGSFASGFIFLAAAIAIERVKINKLKKAGENEWIKKNRTLAPLAWKNLTLAFAASLLTVFINPYTYRVLYDLKDNVTDQYTLNYIVEWLTPNFHQTEGLLFLFLFFLFVEILFLAKKKIDPTQFTIVTIAMWMAFQSNRHIPIFALVVTPYFLETMELIPEIITLGIFKNRFILLSSIFLFAIGIIQFTPLQHNLAYMMDPSAFAENEDYPKNALEFLKKHPPQGNLFNDYGWGGYIIGNSAFRLKDGRLRNENENMRVFVDGRMSYWKSKTGEMILKDYSDISAVQDNWKDLMEKYRISWVFIDKNTILGKVLNLSPAWKKIYEDGKVMIAIKK